MIVPKILLLSLLLLPGVGAAAPRDSRVAAAAGDSATVVAIADALWERMLTRDISARQRLGLPVRRLPSPAIDEAESDAAFARSLLARLDSAGAPPSGTEAWNLAAVVRARAEEMEARGKFFWFQNPVSPYANGLREVHAVFRGWRFSSAEDLGAYLDLLGHYPRVMEDYVAYLRGQARRGYVLPKDELAAAVTLISNLRVEPARSPLAVDSSRLTSVAGDQAARFRAQVEAEIVERVIPSYERLLAYLTGPYASAAPSTIGLSQYPGGETYYRYLVRSYLTFDMSPEEVHQLGLREVARLHAEMDSIRRVLRYKGTKDDFLSFLRTDPRFVPRSPDDIRQRMLRFMDAMQPKLSRAFARVPDNPYDVRRLDPALEPGMTFGYYSEPTAGNRTGTYFFNGANLDKKTLAWFEGLTYHELNPGHHLHLSMMQGQLDRLHPLRRDYSSTAFSEGWAEYGAHVAGELGGYADPYDRYGRRMMELFAAIRLVLDTGMNLLGWDRAKAMQYMRENSLMSEPEIASETLRYCCDIPAQALGYRMGFLRILQLRERAQRALGPRFDLKGFHQVILGDGPLPFTAMDRRVEDFIARSQGME